MTFGVVTHPDTFLSVDAYRRDLLTHTTTPGQRLARALAADPTSLADPQSLIAALFATKTPQIFAESQVNGDGSDWTERELQLLGDFGVAVDVTVFDDGSHDRPVVHATPFAGTLLFVPGLLLQNGRGQPPADWSQVVRDGAIDEARFAQIYERRLLPLLRFADDAAARRGQRAFVTMPGLGCGQFAGRFRGQLGAHLERALLALLQRHAASLRHTSAIWFDPYRECRNARHDFGGLSLRVRPLLAGNQDKPQLLPPVRYAEHGDAFADCRLFSFVAWDHVSWPGNDFYLGARATDDGVKAAATDAIGVLTGVAGTYDAARNAYLPPPPFATWGQLVADRALTLPVRDRIVVLS